MRLVTHVHFLADEAALIEMHPSYRLDFMFRTAARLSGKLYMPMRLPESNPSWFGAPPTCCFDSADWFTVDAAHFMNALDGAVRAARQFHDGRAECGLRCPPEVLALDDTLHGHLYRPGETHGRPPSLNFPCGGGATTCTGAEQVAMHTAALM